MAWFHACGGLNKCKNQGACGYSVDPSNVPAGAKTPYVAGNPDNWVPSQNQCNTKGGCGAPIPEKQLFNEQDAYPVPPSDRPPYADKLGPGKSVWEYARALFEDRMKKRKIDFGPAGPTSEVRKSLSPTSNS